MSMLIESEANLRNRLMDNIKGEVRFDPGDLSLYATDASNYRYIPIGVVIPKTKEDIIQTIKICRSMDIPVVSRGGGTGLAGQTTNAAVVMDMTKYYHHILEINPKEKWIRVEPGIILDEVNKAVERYNLIVGPDPATHSHCTIGGMLGNNSCGIHAQWAGKMQENTLELEILTYDGDIFTVGETSLEELQLIVQGHSCKAKIYRDMLRLRNKYADKIRNRYPHIPRRVSGYNLDELLPENNFNIARALVGSESTLVTILEAKIKLLERPKVRGVIVTGYSNIDKAADDVPKLVQLNPIGLEAVDSELKNHIQEKHLHEEGLKCLSEGNAWLFLEFGAQSEEELHRILKKNHKILKEITQKDDEYFQVIKDKDSQERLWKVRESALGATSRLPNNKSAWPGWEDSAVPPEKLGDYLRDLKKLMDKYDYEGSLYGHFGQGCVHSRMNFNLVTHDGIKNYHEFIKEAAKLVAQYGGSLSGEHGDGQSRAELLDSMFGKDIVSAMNEFKNIWDPKNKMNPGKIVHPNSATDHLRLGEDFENYELETHFSFTDDDGSFSYATQRCVGVGKCRNIESGTMCPSFKVTFEEKHSTRGRAHLLFEMMKKDSLLKPWKSEEVKESLELCLACKGCKSDCPVSVDMATYKAEFLSHYFKGKLRPMAAYTMGLIFFWNRIASFFPRIANFFMHTAPFSWMIKKLGGIAPKRELPKYAPKTFRKMFKERDHSDTNMSQEVILWVDSFNNYFHPNVLLSLSESLEQLGFKVRIPKHKLCCGRPLYDYGMLNLAKKMLLKVMKKLHDDIHHGTPIIFAEPSCMAVFQDELRNLFPHDINAKRLSEQCQTLAQFVESRGLELNIEKDPDHHYVWHGHCHHKSLNKEDQDIAFLKNFGEAKNLETGCCGMAGSFGFEKGEKYKVSMEIAHKDFLPKIHKEGKKAILVADGFSCREQVKQTEGHYPLHSAELLKRALKKKEH